MEKQLISEKLIGPSESRIIHRTIEIVEVDTPVETDSDKVAPPVITRKMGGPGYAPIPMVTIDYPTAYVHHQPIGSDVHFTRG